MKYPVDLKLEAHQDVIEAKVWYELQREGLGDEFYEEIEKTKDLISENPYAFEVKYGKVVRWKETERFPYIIVYVVRNNRVIVLAIVGTHRNPWIWKKRVEKDL